MAHVREQITPSRSGKTTGVQGWARAMMGDVPWGRPEGRKRNVQ